MAILLIGGGKPGVWGALKRSVKRSNVHAVFLFLLGVESVVGSYLAWYAVRCGLPLALPAALTYTVWCREVLLVVSILAAAAVGPPMFIGFSLLAAEEPSDSSFLPGPQQAAYID
jgi:hypothetical protein